MSKCFGVLLLLFLFLPLWGKRLVIFEKPVYSFIYRKLYDEGEENESEEDEELEMEETFE